MSNKELLDKYGVEFLGRYVKKAYTLKPRDRLVIEIEDKDLENVFRDLLSKYGEDSFYLSTIAGTDMKDEGVIVINYFVYLIRNKKYLIVRTKVSRDDPKVKSLLTLGIEAALAGECEAYDVLGIRFEGNKYLKRAFFVPTKITEKGIFPLRKDVEV